MAGAEGVRNVLGEGLAAALNAPNTQNLNGAQAAQQINPPPLELVLLAQQQQQQLGLLRAQQAYAREMTARGNQHHSDEFRNYQARINRDLTAAMEVLGVNQRSMVMTAASGAYPLLGMLTTGVPEMPAPIRYIGPNQTTDAEKKALTLLEEQVGKDAIAKIHAGGGYPIQSKFWPSVVYIVPQDPHMRIRILDRGVMVAQSCLVSGRYGNLPWPDAMLQRIKAIQIDETVVFETGILHDLTGNLDKAVRARLWRWRLYRVLKKVGKVTGMVK